MNNGLLGSTGVCFGVSNSSPESGSVQSVGGVTVFAGRAGGNCGGEEKERIGDTEGSGEGAREWEATISSTVARV